ncbi:hypothetical protein [Thermomonospora cellulosilytica]|uniref:Uncharacterized protein n=1 Tax=Thermomonospora cellulosilytica TaxID=1411118 RepID=A0A7W3N0U4_9ACTN|nr:hypothetical protein [Thermomonospora cellulosilytica]MBA9005448.1 hypothetical protein [Thermomonospora cellulosilytica]
MRPGHGDLHEWVGQRVHSAFRDALRADPDAIAASVADTDGGLDPHSREFLRGARRLVLACATGLVAVLEAHRPVADPSGGRICGGCGTATCPTLRRVAQVLAAHSVRPPAIDRAEAWRRADACLSRDRRRPVAIEIHEFEHGFVARPVHGTRPDGSLLVIDRCTGRLTRWPSLPLETLAREYRAHLTGRPPNGTRSPGH